MGSTANIELVSTLKAKKSAEFRFLISKNLHYPTYLPSKAQSFTILVTDFINCTCYLNARKKNARNNNLILDANNF